MPLTSTQIGLVAENLVTNKLVIASDGRFVPFKPVADDYGIDVLVYDKITGQALPLQIKARTKTLRKTGGSERGSIAHFGVRKVALHQKGQTRLLAVLLDEPMTTVRCLWVIPLDTLEQVGNNRRDRVVIRPNSSENSIDRFRKYYFSSVDALARSLVTEFNNSNRNFPGMPILR